VGFLDTTLVHNFLLQFILFRRWGFGPLNDLLERGLRVGQVAAPFIMIVFLMVEVFVSTVLRTALTSTFAAT